MDSLQHFQDFGASADQMPGCVYGAAQAAKSTGSYPLLTQFQKLELDRSLGLWPLVTIDTSDLGDISGLGDKAISGLLALLNRNS
jgi:hypothetical protein